MGLLERMKSLLRANIKDILQKAEDPEHALDQLIKTMDAELAEARAGVAGAIRDERRLRDTHEHHLREAEAMLERATVAAGKGRDDLAREALRRRRQHQETAEPLKAELQAQTRALGELQEHLSYLEAKVAQARRARTALLTRRRLARARRGLETVSGARGLSSADDTLDRLADTVDELDAEAQAYAELAEQDVSAQLLDVERDAKAEQAAIEAELRDIKERLARKDNAG